MLQSVFTFTTFGDESHIIRTFQEAVVSNCHGCNLQQSLSGRSIAAQTGPVAGRPGLVTRRYGGFFP